MLIYNNTFENIKTINCNFPIEDQFYADENEAIIADGITRDPIGIKDLKSCSLETMLEKYPRPSGSELAAKEIVNTFSKTQGTLKERLRICNQRIKELNDKYNPICDYLEHDYYAAVASCIKINSNSLDYAFICDCGIIIYDKIGNIKFQTDDDKELYSDPFTSKIGIPWYLPEARIIVRRDYRNNLNNIQNGKCVSYGAITGEEQAMEFVRCGTLELFEGDSILLYSDGMAPLLHEKDFINNILYFNKTKFEQFINEKAHEDNEKYGKEKTIILYKL